MINCLCTKRYNLPLTPSEKAAFSSAIIVSLAIAIISTLVLGGLFSTTLNPVSQAFSFMATVEGSSIGIALGMTLCFLAAFPLMIRACRPLPLSNLHEGLLEIAQGYPVVPTFAESPVPEKWNNDLLELIACSQRVSDVLSFSCVSKRLCNGLQQLNIWQNFAKKFNLQLPKNLTLRDIKICIIIRSGVIFGHLALNKNLDFRNFIAVMDVIPTSLRPDSDSYYNGLNFNDSHFNGLYGETLRLLSADFDQEPVRAEVQDQYGTKGIITFYKDGTLEKTQESFIKPEDLNIELKPGQPWAVWKEYLVLGGDGAIELIYHSTKQRRFLKDKRFLGTGCTVHCLSVYGSVLVAGITSQHGVHLLQIWNLNTSKFVKFFLDRYPGMGPMRKIGLFENTLIVLREKGIRTFNLFSIRAYL